MKQKIDYVFNEGNIIKELHALIDKTYESHTLKTRYNQQNS